METMKRVKQMELSGKDAGAIASELQVRREWVEALMGTDAYRMVAG